MSFRRAKRGISLCPALSKITPGLSFPRKRESSSMWTYVDPRLRGGGNTRDFHLFGWAGGTCTLRVDSARNLALEAIDLRDSSLRSE